MKFLCVACDQAMKLQDAMPAEEPGTLAVVYVCSECDHQIAMLTNPWETQMVQSLGIRIGPDRESSEAKCPFAGMVEGLQEPTEAPAEVQASPEPVGKDEGLLWTPGALERLERIPVFVRPMAKQGIEHWARDNGQDQVTEEVLEMARGRMGM